jgi:hypothetical protein
MQYVCDAPGGKTWFRIETEGEAALESDLMRHAVEKHFLQARERALATYAPSPGRWVEQDIGLKDHLRRSMPVFLTLRDPEGGGLATAMLPPEGRVEPGFRPVIVGPSNNDPYPAHGPAIARLAQHFGTTLERQRCYPYGRL